MITIMYLQVAKKYLVAPLLTLDKLLVVSASEKLRIVQYVSLFSLHPLRSSSLALILLSRPPVESFTSD
jgi:hypothetical protein